MYIEIKQIDFNKILEMPLNEVNLLVTKYIREEDKDLFFQLLWKANRR